MSLPQEPRRSDLAHKIRGAHGLSLAASVQPAAANASGARPYPARAMSASPESRSATDFASDQQRSAKHVNLNSHAAVPQYGVAPPAAPRRAAMRLLRALQRWWQHLWIDEMTAYFSEAANHVDLEYRMRAWNDDAQRRGRVPLF